MYSSEKANGGYRVLDGGKPVEAETVVELLNGLGQNQDYVARVSYQQVRDQLMAERDQLAQQVEDLQGALTISAEEQSELTLALDEAAARTAELQGALDANTGGRWSQIEIDAAKWRAQELKRKAEEKA